MTSTKRPRVVAWSLEHDPSFELRAREWIKRAGGREVALIHEEKIEVVGVRRRGDPETPSRQLWSQDLAHFLDASKVTIILTRSGRIEHPSATEIESAALKEGLILASIDEDPADYAPKQLIPVGLSPTKRLLLGREAGARDGRHQSGPAPYGYRRDKARNLVIDTEAAEVVRMIYRLYNQLKSMKKVVADLGARGLRTRRGKRWSVAGVSWILKNETYVGRVHFGSIRAEGKHPPIIASIVFNRAQKLMRMNNLRGGKASD